MYADGAEAEHWMIAMSSALSVMHPSFRRPTASPDFGPFRAESEISGTCVEKAFVTVSNWVAVAVHKCLFQVLPVSRSSSFYGSVERLFIRVILVKATLPSHIKMGILDEILSTTDTIKVMRNMTGPLTSQVDGVGEVANKVPEGYCVPETEVHTKVSTGGIDTQHSRLRPRHLAARLQWSGQGHRVTPEQIR